MENKLPELSVFFPFWNEEKNIRRVTEQALSIVPDIANKWEILLIDDGSTDKTKEIAQQLAKENSQVKCFSHTPNRGYGAALKEGLVHSQYAYIVFTDGDGQFDFSEVNKFIGKIHTHDLVIGYRKQRRDNIVRHILMNLLKVWDFVLFGLYFRDIDCGFKMFRKSAVDQLMPLRSEGAMTTTEILAKAKRKKLKIAEVEVTHYSRTFGAQTGANLFVVVRAVLESFILFLDIKNKRF